ncbi:MAG: L,D-transpeptidase [Actinobacteria bacterium]|nr:L,D-transpeptidase [Actinomycetota bacterium]
MGRISNRSKPAGWRSCGRCGETSTGTNEHYQHPAGYTALAETPDGRDRIDWQVDGWRRNELGRLWCPKYFHPDGIAIHGFSSVPATPSSHGCVRVTIPAMNFIWDNDIAPNGSTVWVYGRAP